MSLQKYFKTMSAYAESTDFVSLAKNYQTELAEKSCMKLAITVSVYINSCLVSRSAEDSVKRFFFTA
jgi:hypothetical protein